MSSPSTSDGDAANCRSPALQGVWCHVAQFLPPRSQCDLERVSKTVRSELSHAARDGRILQRYWHARCMRLRWAAEESGVLVDKPLHIVSVDERKRRLLLYALTKQEVRKNWKEEYREEAAAFLRRNVRGFGVVDRDVQRPHAVTTLNVPLPPTSDSINATTGSSCLLPSETTVLEQRADCGDVEFAKLCLDGGLSREHFHREHGVRVSHREGRRNHAVVDPLQESFGRAEYRKDAKLGKRKGKHAKGERHLWAAWTQCEEADD